MNEIIERVEQTGLTLTGRLCGKTISLPDLAELLRLAKMGAAAEKSFNKPTPYCVEIFSTHNRNCMGGAGGIPRGCRWKDFCQLRRTQ